MSVTLGIDSALRGIPNFSGGTEADLASYIIECDYVMNNIHENLKTVVFNNIVAKLKGTAFQSARYRNFADWAELKAHLRAVFGTPHSISYLQSQMSNIKQRSAEDIRSFAGRTEKCFHELVGALTVGLEPASATAVAASYKTGALTAFVNGTRPEIRALLKARDVSSFEKAVSIATEEEQDLLHINRRFNTNKNYGKNNANKKNIKCNKCSKMPSCVWSYRYIVAFATPPPQNEGLWLIRPLTIAQNAKLLVS
ncbi:uncharacterized protein LOC132932540 [Metopolophium dirhodum]|uniref:uncharacterized protein LOC132932540 n=1 Tax=Metopolophium dirhodum TaxID=44670 RepID=UPI00298F4327|nr:uncharacterized protein LOC132932540 [Metopolophium dirhodum]